MIFPDEGPLYLTQLQYRLIRGLYSEKYPDADVEEFLKNFDLIKPIETNIATRLGSLWNEQQPRVAPDPEIPRVRGLGYSPSQVFIDEPFDTTEERSLQAQRETRGDYASQWLEHRVLCRGNVLACLSGETC